MADDKKPKDFLDWLGVRENADFFNARPLGSFFGALLVLVIPLLFFSALRATACCSLTSQAMAGSSSGGNI